jgi:archaellum component FlaC
MRDVATRKDIDEVIDILKDFMGQVDTQFSGMDARFDTVEKNQLKHNEEFQKLNDKYEKLLSTIDGFIA